MMQLFPLSSIYGSSIAHGRLKVWCFGHISNWSGVGERAGARNNRLQRNSRRFKMAAYWYVSCFWRSSSTGNFGYYNGTFTLGITSCLNMNASFYADSVNAATWNKARLFFWVGCVFAGNGFMQIHEINPTGKFSKRPWNLWKASTVHEQSKYWQYWSVFFDWDRKGAIYGEKGQL